LRGGIPYFPLDTVLDSKFDLIEAEFGIIMTRLRFCLTAAAAWVGASFRNSIRRNPKGHFRQKVV
jgi:hypothetical protein